MQVVVGPSNLTGTVQANPSKSHAQRAIALAALTPGTSILHALGKDDDTESALRVAEAMGAVLNNEGNGSMRISGAKQLRESQWNCGESGLCMRMFSAIAGLFSAGIILTGEGTLMSRPVGPIGDTLRSLGVHYSDHEGFLPIRIQGPYQKADITVDGNAGSQFLTGLLIALPATGQSYQIKVLNLKSKPYIDLTLATLAEFGVHIMHHGYEAFVVSENQRFQPAAIHIQGDWSGMAFILVAAAIAGEVAVLGLPDASVQPDGKIIDALRLSGADADISKGGISVRRSVLNAFQFDCTHCPDLFPPLAALAVHCNGVSRIHGTHRLKSKESDRAFSLVQEMQKLGVRIWEEEDSLVIEDGSIKGGQVATHGDHRIAMALAVLGLKAETPVIIAGAECVSKSYPGFFQDLQTLGGSIRYADSQ